MGPIEVGPAQAACVAGCYGELPDPVAMFPPAMWDTSVNGVWTVRRPNGAVLRVIETAFSDLPRRRTPSASDTMQLYVVV